MLVGVSSSKGELALEKIRDEIVSYARKEDLNIFYGTDLPASEIPAEEIQWRRKGDWKGFIQIAKSEGAKTIILEEQVLEAEDIKPEAISPDIMVGEGELFNELLRQIKPFSKYVGRVGALKLIWIKDGVRYSFSERTKWFDDFLSLIASLPKERITRPSILGSAMLGTLTRPLPKELKDKSVEDLTDQLSEFIRKEFPEGAARASYTAKELFWEQKGIRRFEADPETRLLMEKVEVLVEKRLMGQRVEEQKERLQQKMQEEKERLPDLIEGCIEWAKEYRLKKIMKTNLRAFLAEKGETLSRTSEDILLQQINFRLKEE